MANLMRHLHRWCMAAVLGALAAAATAQTPQEVPALTARVIDHTGTLTPEQRQALDNKLALIEKSDGTQIVVLVVASTYPEDIESYTNRVANSWKVGRKDVGDGLLVVVAKNDRRMRIEVAKALEGAVPDLAAKHVIDDVITPRFKHEDFAGGINAGIDRLVELVRKEGLPAPTSAASTSQGWVEVATTLGGLYGMAGAALTMTFAVGGFLIALGMTVTGTLLAALSWFLFGNDSVTLVAGLVGYAFGGVLIIRWAGTLSNTAAVTTAASKLSQKTTSSNNDSPSWWSSSSSSDSGSSGSSFSSGGGGDFGGGGASGSW